MTVYVRMRILESPLLGNCTYSSTGFIVVADDGYTERRGEIEKEKPVILLVSQSVIDHHRYDGR